MKIAMIIVRTLMGLLFIFGAVVYFLKLFEAPPMEGALESFNKGLKDSGYFFNLLKATELACGILLVTGFFVPLALVILAPIIINILMVHVFLDPSGLPVAAFLVLGELFLAYYYRKAFAPLLTPKYEG